MTRLPFLLLFAVSFLIAITFPPLIHALGSGSTLAVAYGTATVCAIVASEPNQRIICYRPGNTNSSSGTIIPVLPNISYSIVAGGETTICALRSGGFSLLCWETNNQTFPEKRLYSNNTVSLQSLTIGEERICATTNTSSAVTCWRPIGNTSEISPDGNYTMGKITSGSGFSCGIVLSHNNRVSCWGNSVATEIETQFGNMSMSNIEAGVSHVCGIDSKGDIICRGNNSTGQLNVPLNKDLNFASGLALGEGFSCAIRRSNGTVVCWGSMTETPVADVEFESIVSGLNFTCGLITSNFSVICWGPGWPETMGSTSNSSRQILPLGAQILPGKRAIFKSDENGGTPVSLVDYAVPAIMAGELARVLDIRVGPPELNETEAVELVAYIAINCVNLEGKERPTIGDIVSNLERALTVCDGSHGSISSSGFSIVSE
ncbi:Regulator of chromosome condensation 1/beta-lactamase-inhibitor protein II [Corchorus olitorius]|uniref:non-specific serine/threonine protein kinase n=1 Tax=Corchorus olitorius TaxID=93759 RepID=A0A1R3I0E9_9ROSI|nr:Regulator of chromosome condensation 1/beta-lactamase-inhibitor protein II [Corchorus olitorius]